MVLALVFVVLAPVVLTATVYGIALAVLGEPLLAGTVALVCGALLLSTELLFGEHLIERIANASRERSGDEQLERVIQRFSQQLGIVPPTLVVEAGDVPTAYTIDGPLRKPQVVVTEELVELLDDDELAAVLAHECAHVANRDATVLTMATVLPTLLGTAASVANFHQRDMRRTPIPYFYPLICVFAVLFGLLTIVWGVTHAVVTVLSRQREYAADAVAAQLCGGPDTLASALTKMQSDVATRPVEDLRTRVDRQSFQILPLAESGRRPDDLAGFEPLHPLLMAASIDNSYVQRLLATHPPTKRRLDRLERDLVRQSA
ncbi:M48 family metallopeptidase [Halomicrobium sp. HM KBTZ05]|uniref:M48 family metallopeptidase n=1 Tax=Halomicrobium sp. HM KBTZ05 TaxID=3242663 RepID=UPI0035584766